MVRWKLWPHSDEEYLKYDESHSVCFSCWGSCLKLQRVIWIQTQKAPWSFLSLDQSGGVMDQATGDRAMLPSKTPHHQLLKMLSCCTEALWAFSVDCCHSGNCAVVTIILSREGRLKKIKALSLDLKNRYWESIWLSFLCDSVKTVFHCMSVCVCNMTGLF